MAIAKPTRRVIYARSRKRARKIKPSRFKGTLKALTRGGKRPCDCEWKAQAGNACAASFDWSCSGICKSVERMEEVHQRCGAGEETIWQGAF
ncbi:putative beta-1,3-galactosyltransferase 6 [Platanthera guangdongensis]|uniref:Beta-1,3-galactosyltransferase 6 n=1 Tax=Platanthera guangdongensis TaxID=2320717 RepID=A0ABR2MPK9_9ASPA